jgi:hypothetical protein
MIPAVLALSVFAALAALDGVYLHLVRLRLHARPASWREHVWHTASAVLFVPIVATLYLGSAGGLRLWLGAAAVVALHVVEVFDVRSERASREDLGGLSRGELAVHVAAIGTRTVSLVALFAAIPGAAWWGHAVGPALPAALVPVVHGMLAGAVAIAGLHVWLAVRHCPVCLRGARASAT